MAIDREIEHYMIALWIGDRLCRKAVLLWMPDPATRDAIVRQALEGDVDLKAASEVMCSRTPSQMRQFKQIYFSNFSVGLEDDIASEASGEQQKASPAYT